jgi:hypothetical protein
MVRGSLIPDLEFLGSRVLIPLNDLPDANEITRMIDIYSLRARESLESIPLFVRVLRVEILADDTNRIRGQRQKKSEKHSTKHQAPP